MRLETHRTRTGYVAALRLQDGTEIGRGYCSTEEVIGYVSEKHGAEVGAFSFGKLARGIGALASKIARIKALRSALKFASNFPPPIGTVASGANAALRAIAGVRRGNPAAILAWREAAERAREEPNSPTAVAMRLAMKAAGRPVAPPGAVERVSSKSSDEAAAAVAGWNDLHGSIAIEYNPRATSRA